MRKFHSILILVALALAMSVIFATSVLANDDVTVPTYLTAGDGVISGLKDGQQYQYKNLYLGTDGTVAETDSAALTSSTPVVGIVQVRASADGAEWTDWSPVIYVPGNSTDNILHYTTKDCTGSYEGQTRDILDFVSISRTYLLDPPTYNVGKWTGIEINEEIACKYGFSDLFLGGTTCYLSAEAANYLSDPTDENEQAIKDGLNSVDFTYAYTNDEIIPFEKLVRFTFRVGKRQSAFSVTAGSPKTLCSFFVIKDNGTLEKRTVELSAAWGYSTHIITADDFADAGYAVDGYIVGMLIVPFYFDEECTLTASYYNSTYYNSMIVIPTDLSLQLYHDGYAVEADKKEGSSLLQYELSSDGTYYILAGIGECTDTAIVIPSTYYGLPVKEIKAEAFFGNKTITEVVIPDSVTSIGSWAFGNCSKLISVSLGNSVTSIGNYAFGNCGELTSMTVDSGNVVYHSSGNCIIKTATKTLVAACKASVIPTDGSVTSIGSYAFGDCCELTSVVIPDTITSIGSKAFYGCSGLMSVNIPDSVTSIGPFAFSGCTALTSMTVDSGNTVYHSLDNCIIETATKTLTHGCKASVIPTDGSVTSIGSYAFFLCSGLTSVSVGNCVTSIGEYAFHNCTGLTSVSIGDSVTSIGNYAFEYCRQLTIITIPENVTNIGASVFHNCSNLTIYCYENSTAHTYAVENSIPYKVLEAVSPSEGLSFELSSDGTYYILAGIGECTDTAIVIPSTYYGLPVKVIKANAFINNKAITEVIIPNSVTTIGSQAFFSCSGLTSVIIPDSVTSIGKYAFGYCAGLTSMTVDSNNTVYHSYGNCIIETATKTLTHGCGASIIPTDGSVTSIGNSAFYGCSGLTSVNIPNSVTSIGEWAFEGCRGLTSVNIPNSVTSIGNYVFSYCTGLTSVSIPDTVTSIGNQAFYYCSGLTSVSIPNSVTSIGNHAFSGCTGLTNITIPDSVTSIGTNAFYNCTNLTIYCYENSTAHTYAVENSIPYKVLEAVSPSEGLSFELSSYGTYYSLAGIGECTDTAIVIPSTYNGLPVKVIKANALKNNKAITEVIIPNSVTTIGSQAFYNCTELISIEIPDSVTSIGAYALSFCTALEEITVSSANTRYYSAGNCIIETATNSLIFGCKNSVIPADGSVEKIANCSFYGCSQLTSIEIPETVTSIGSYAFYNCTKLTAVNTPNSVTTIGANAFMLCSNLTSIEISAGVTSIAPNAFYSCYRLTSLIVSDENTVYHSSNNCIIKTATKTLTHGCQTSIIPDDGSVTSIGDYAFGGCSAMRSIAIPNAITSIGKYAFSSCNALSQIEIPNTVTSIGAYAFQACAFSTIQIPDGVTTIDKYTFYYCLNLKNIEIPNSVTTISDSAFARCSGLIGITISDSVTTIGNNVFQSCTKLTVQCYEDSLAHSYAVSNSIPYVFISSGVVPSAGLQYELSADGTYYLLSGMGSCIDTVIIIPSAYNGIPIKQIKASSFKNKTAITHVTIPDSVTTIGDYAFYRCTGLKSVEIPSGVTKIGKQAFIYCSALTSIFIPDSVNEIGGYVFAFCTKLTSMTVSDDNTVYHSSNNCIIRTDTKVLVYGCKSSVIPTDGSVAIIGTAAFCGQSGLTSIIIPEVISAIGNSAFYNCSGLTSIEIPAGVTNIYDYAFSYCAALTDIKIAEGNTAYHASGNCIIKTDTNTLTHGCKSSVIPTDGSVSAIKSNAFYGCTTLADITIPDSVRSIGSCAFYNCYALTSVEIPNNVTEIGPSAFYGAGLTNVKIPNSITSISAYTFAYCRKLTEIEIPNTVTEIADFAFYYCVQLGNLSVPNTVASIGANAFANCTSINIHCYESSPIYQFAIDKGIPVSVLVCPVTQLGTSLLLEDRIGIKVYLEIDTDSVDPTLVKLNVTRTDTDNGESLNGYSSIAHSESWMTALSGDDEDKKYSVIIYLPAKELDNTKFSAAIDCGDGNIIDAEILTFAEYIANAEELANQGNEEFAEAMPLINSLSSYTKYVDNFFKGGEHEAYRTEIDTSEIQSPSRTDTELSGIEFYGTSLILEDKVTIRHYFTVKDIENFKKNCRGNVEFRVAGDCVYYDIAEISPEAMGTVYTLTITDTSTGNKMGIDFSALNYIAQVADSDNANLANLAHAMYDYYVAAKDYNDNHNH